MNAYVHTGKTKTATALHFTYLIAHNEKAMLMLQLAATWYEEAVLWKTAGCTAYGHMTYAFRPHPNHAGLCWEEDPYYLMFTTCLSTPHTRLGILLQKYGKAQLCKRGGQT